MEFLKFKMSKPTETEKLIKLIPLIKEGEKTHYRLVRMKKTARILRRGNFDECGLVQSSKSHQQLSLMSWKMQQNEI